MRKSRVPIEKHMDPLKKKYWNYKKINGIVNKKQWNSSINSDGKNKKTWRKINAIPVILISENISDDSRNECGGRLQN